ncbi:glycine/betaine ABC transporter permease [Lentibacillus amyloliquefaciens]|uniref:Glycine/betaine ABC transporter permease n=1 Tax=Lentibacillus amyloliquefaciens TaxID=1472767 RepID=A0A0U3WC20_9BACI|nr:glycine/betaine ABC transporter permease [Lentibacillus amyloliquefaciens]
MLVSIFIIWGAFFPENVQYVLGLIDGFISDTFGWFYLWSTTGFVLFAAFLIFGPYGKIKLGRPDDEPEYSYFTWFAFLFTAGMGVGLVFYGVTEPVTHFYSPPSADPETTAAAKESMQYTLFHWGFHPWATYAVLALTLAYFKFRHRAPALISSAFSPLIGDRSKGGLGTAIDTLAVFATVFGIATSLGLGATQITAGLSYTFDGIPNTLTTNLIVIAVITVLFMLSATTGINRGIRYLSWANIILAIALMAFVFVLGSSVQMVESFSTTLGNYLQNLPSMTLGMNAFGGDREFLNSWTLFYWAWWIGWSPFVGTFIARVSRGRTIREFVIGVTAVPVIFSAFWFSVFGVSGLNMDSAEGGIIHQLMNEMGNEVALFAFLESTPAAAVVIGITVLLITSFFVTSADSGTFVLGMLTTGGKLNPNTGIKAIWGIVLAATAAVLLWSGGLSALQMAMLIAAFPFAILMIFMCISLIKALKSEHDILQIENKQREHDPEYRENLRKELRRRREGFKKTLPDTDNEEY